MLSMDFQYTTTPNAGEPGLPTGFGEREIFEGCLGSTTQHQYSTTGAETCPSSGGEVLGKTGDKNACAAGEEQYGNKLYTTKT